jgi:hypothetical protein
MATERLELQTPIDNTCRMHNRIGYFKVLMLLENVTDMRKLITEVNNETISLNL